MDTTKIKKINKTMYKQCLGLLTVRIILVDKLTSTLDDLSVGKSLCRYI